MLAQRLLDVLAKWDLKTDQIHAVVTDNAANACKGVKDAELPHLRCFAHSLQLVILEAVMEQRVVKDALAKAKSLVGNLAHSSVSSQRFRQIQKNLNLPVHVIPQDVATRWNSTYYMLERLMEQRTAVNMFSADTNRTGFTANEWEVMGKVVKLLAPFEEITKTISLAKATSSVCIPAIFALSKYLSSDMDWSGVVSMKGKLISSITDRFSYLETDRLLVVATVLDPRFKGKAFLHALTLQLATDWIKEAEGEFESQPVAKKPRHIIGGLWDCLEESDEISTNAANNSSPPERSAMEIELSLYLAEPKIHRDSDIFEWWRTEKLRFPKLAVLAQQYLSAPPASVASERLFSLMGNILTPERNRLQPVIVDELAFMKFNLESWNFNLD